MCATPPPAGSRRENAQPLTLSYVKGTFAVAHNGNLVNVDNLRRHYEYRGAIFHTSTDSEIISYIIAQERLLCPSIERRWPMRSGSCGELFPWW